MNSADLEPRRDLTLTHATSLVVGITIGTGIFLKTASMAQAVGTPLLVLAAWVVAGIVAMLGALCFAELGAPSGRLMGAASAGLGDRVNDDCSSAPPWRKP